MKKLVSVLGAGNVLALILVGLKVYGVITWPWLWILFPLWLPAFIILLGYFLKELDV